MSTTSRILAVVLLTSVVLCGCGKPAAVVQTPLSKAKQLLFEKKYDKALAQCDEILSSQPTNYDAMLLRGETRLKKGDLYGAIEDFTKAIDIDPDRPDGYSWRYGIYNDLSETEVDVDKKRRLSELAADDLRTYMASDPSSRTAFQGDLSGEKSDAVTSNVGSEFLASEFETADADREALLTDNDVPQRDQQNVPAKAFALDKESPAPNEPTAPSSDENRQAEEDKITKLDLKSELDEPTLPPHEEQKNEIPLELPPTQITRFDIQAFQPFGIDSNTSLLLPPARPTTGLSVTGQGLRPQVSGPATSGITSQLQPVRDATPRVGHFSLQEHMATNRRPLPRPAIPTTGIRSDVQPVAQLGMGAPSFGGAHFAAHATGGISPPYGFLPVEARDKFGPRLNFAPTAQPAAPEPEENQAAPSTPSPSSRPAAPTGPILTMALPGTSLFGNNAEANRQQNRFAPDLADPEYTPFVPRPTGTPSTPLHLPPQQ